LIEPPVHALVPAAGQGERFGSTEPKQFTEVAGRPVLSWTAARLLDAGVASLTVAVPAASVERARALFDDPRVLIVAGASSRQGSVEVCLAACPADPEELVLVHDGARPAVAVADVAACVAAATEHDGAVLGRTVSDTLKLVAGGEIQSTVERRFLFRAETPQVFSRELLERALSEAATAGFVGTDEASAVERLPGVRLAAVEARHPNPKLTTPADLALVAALLTDRMT
jgi:2-C-methyl-D-erythritol 4-phosphate cytidylyltransferase